MQLGKFPQSVILKIYRIETMANCYIIFIYIFLTEPVQDENATKVSNEIVNFSKKKLAVWSKIIQPPFLRFVGRIHQRSAEQQNCLMQKIFCVPDVLDVVLWGSETKHLGPLDQQHVRRRRNGSDAEKNIYRQLVLWSRLVSSALETGSMQDSIKYRETLN